VCCARDFAAPFVLKDQALGVFVSEMSSVFDSIRPRIADRFVPASGGAPACRGTHTHSLADDERAGHGALAASAGETAPADPHSTAGMASHAAPGDRALPEVTRH
jgi:hypothetical protein